MRQSVFKIIEEAKSQWGGYSALLAYRLMNVCVKAEPAALLSFKVKWGGGEYTLDLLANVWSPREDQFEIFPHDEEYIPDICKGILTTHPEFKIEVKDADQKDDEEATKTILCTMPVVNKSRHDAMLDIVDAMCKEIQPQLDASHEQYKLQLAEKLLGETDEHVEEAKKELQKVWNGFDVNNQQLRKSKEKEIEDAYLNYLGEQMKQQQVLQEQEAAHSPKAGQSIRLSDMNNEDF